MQIITDGATSSRAKRPHNRPVTGAALGSLVVLALVGMIVADPGRRGSVAIVTVLLFLSIPTVVLAQRPSLWAPITVLGGALLLVVAGVLGGPQPTLGGAHDKILVTNVAAGAVFALLLVSEVWMLRSRPPYSGDVDDRHTGLVIAGSLAAAGAGSFAVADFGLGPSIAAQRWPLFVVGVALALGSLAVRVWAIVTLGPLFQARLVIQPGHDVVSSGPYRLVRHPSYLGPVLMFAAMGLLLDNWIGLVLCLVLPIGAYIRRITVEERVLRGGLGTSYERYCATTWRMIPGVW